MTQRSLLLREGFAPSGDRLVTTAFFAAIVHAMIIVGVSFAGDGGPPGATPGLEVVLVAEDLPTAANNPDAAYLSQRTQRGGGTTLEKRAARSPRAPLDQQAQEGASEPRRSGADSVLTGIASNMDIAWSGASGELELTAKETQALVARHVNRPPGEDDAATAELTGKARGELWIAPDTQESALAPYVDAWRRKVERLGTLNFPEAARRALTSGTTRSPIIEVSLAPNGDLTDAKIQRTSGSPQLDSAALQILRLASPFDPFPADLADRVNLLRFAYEWRFEGAVAQTD